MPEVVKLVRRIERQEHVGERLARMGLIQVTKRRRPRHCRSLRATRRVESRILILCLQVILDLLAERLLGAHGLGSKHVATTDQVAVGGVEVQRVIHQIYVGERYVLHLAYAIVGCRMC